jgi:hypothetical protein
MGLDEAWPRREAVGGHNARVTSHERSLGVSSLERLE